MVQAYCSYENRTQVKRKCGAKKVMNKVLLTTGTYTLMSEKVVNM